MSGPHHSVTYTPINTQTHTANTHTHAHTHTHTNVLQMPSSSILPSATPKSNRMSQPPGLQAMKPPPTDMHVRARTHTHTHTHSVAHTQRHTRALGGPPTRAWPPPNN